MNKLILEINSGGGAGGDGRKTPVIPSRRPERLGRRRLNEVGIRFYDLGQVNNNESLSDEPVWSDHPILKTPSYTTSHATWGSTNSWFQGVTYELEPFEDADYAAYTDRFFEYPVTEWKRRYRKILGIDDYDTATGEEIVDFRYDMRFSLRDDTYSGTEERFMPERLLSKADLGGTFATEKETYLTDYHHYWHNDRDYAGYRDLDRLEGQYNPFGDGALRVGGYFPYSTNRSAMFKVTATNDPDADAVTLGDPSGSYDVFLVPQVGMFMATSHSSDWKTSEVLGLCYQVMPRKLWPRFTEGLVLNGDGDFGSDSAVDSWMAYQKSRVGMQYSQWTYTGTGGASSFTYSETPGVPADWTGQERWAGAVNGGNITAEYYYATKYRGSGIVLNNQPDYSTFFTADSSDANFGFSLFRNNSPLLTAVIQKGSSFYYVWDISHTDFGGNFTVSETIEQGDRYRLTRNTDFSLSSEGDPPIPRDGTGEFYTD
jgi:hypothetical protein